MIGRLSLALKGETELEYGGKKKLGAGIFNKIASVSAGIQRRRNQAALKKELKQRRDSTEFRAVEKEAPEAEWWSCGKRDSVAPPADPCPFEGQEKTEEEWDEDDYWAWQDDYDYDQWPEGGAAWGETADTDVNKADVDSPDYATASGTSFSTHHSRAKGSNSKIASAKPSSWLDSSEDEEASTSPSRPKGKGSSKGRQIVKATPKANASQGRSDLWDDSDDTQDQAEVTTSSPQTPAKAKAKAKKKVVKHRPTPSSNEPSSADSPATHEASASSKRPGGTKAGSPGSGLSESSTTDTMVARPKPKAKTKVKAKSKASAKSKANKALLEDSSSDSASADGNMMF